MAETAGIPVPLISLTDVRKHFPLSKGFIWQNRRDTVKAVDGVSFSIAPGETYGLVGESGCGKTTTARMILLLDEPTGGEIRFNGKNIGTFDRDELKGYRASVQAVFQDPWSALNPRMKAGAIISEPLTTHRRLTKQDVNKHVARLLDEVGLHPTHAGRFPHEFSGGQRQRIAIARALSLRPKVIVLDEPVSSLDVSIRAQIMNLLKNLQRQHDISFLIIAHNLATVRYMCHRVGVIYLGKVVEEADSRELFTNPLHPYTRALISASLSARPGKKDEQVVLSGEVASALKPPPGCSFHPRCPLAFERCPVEVPSLREVKPGHKVACHLF